MKNFSFERMSLIGVFLALGLGGCSSESSDSLECSASGVSVDAPYLGVWAPSLFSGLQSIETADDVKALNANLMSLVFSMRVSSTGEFTAESSWSDLGEKIDLFHSAGLGVVLALDSQMEDGSAESPTMDSDLVDSSAFQENLSAAAVELAQVAEKCGVAILVPYNEADLKMGAAASSEWGQSVLDSIRDSYPSGKVLWKLASAGNASTVNVGGYDMAGISLSPSADETPVEFQSRASAEIADAVQGFGAHGVTSVWVSEFGVWGSSDADMTDAEVAEYYDAIFAVATPEAGIEGWMAFDGPSGYDPQIGGMPAGETVAAGFAGLAGL